MKLCVTLTLLACSLATAQSTPPPNFILIFCDDMGYGDLGCFSSTHHRTPRLDTMAAEGVRLTSFYSTSSVCTPSRSSLMTGCYPRTVNMHNDAKGAPVLFPVSPKGLNPAEVTIAEVLKTKGYATMCIGKWHLGDQLEFLPTRQGFDHYYGVPYSNDMEAFKRGDPPLPLMRDETVIEQPANQDLFTKRYTEEAVKFIRDHREAPFFLYLPHNMVHNPLHASDAFRGKSANGLYGDAVEEIDWCVGRILDTLAELGIDDRTLVFFSSDNGAHQKFGGSNAPLRGWKAQTLEGGQRMPCILRWPGHISAGTVRDDIAVTMDLLPTLAKLAGAALPSDRPIDGADIWPVISSAPGAATPHEAFYYYQVEQLQAVRSGKWKLHLPLEHPKRDWCEEKGQERLRLYDLDADIGETKNVAAEEPEVVKRLLGLADRARALYGDDDREGSEQRPAAFVEKPTPRMLP